MENKSEWVDIIQAVYAVIRDSPASTLLTMVGLFLLVLAFLFANKAVKLKPEEMTRSSVNLLYFTLIVGTLCAVIGPVVGIVLKEKKQAGEEQFSAAPGPIVSPAQGLENLYSNAEVTWVVRLIAYDPFNEQELSIAHLHSIGKPEQRFTFVADYAELQGYRVEEAVRKLGGEVVDGYHVSAIVFPLRSPLYPANARGLLQVINLLLANNPNDPLVKGLKPIKNDIENLSRDAREALGQDAYRNGWAWPNYSQYYEDYCKVAQRFRCNYDTSAKGLIGEISDDWHPLGFARIEPSPPCLEKDNLCEIKEWNKQELAKEFGTRVFLIENIELSKLNGHFLFNFHDPKSQIIPYITPTVRQ
jgi:hypothetical protein